MSLALSASNDAKEWKNRNTWPPLIINGANKSFFGTQNTPDVFIQFDFGKSSVAVCVIRIETGDDPVNGRHIKDVTFHGSNDGENWREIGTWWNCNLNAPNAVYNLVQNTVNSYYYHYLKMQVQTNYKSTNELYLKRIEFYGNVKREVESH